MKEKGYLSAVITTQKLQYDLITKSKILVKGKKQ